MKPNAMKARFARGEAACGLNVMFPSPQIVEMIGRLGFDWVFIDLEHGSITIDQLDLLVMAADATGITPIVRPSSNDPVAIGQVLDRGAQGIQVPHVDTAADARRAVAAARFHPLGERGIAGGTRASGYGIGFKPKEFIEVSNREIVGCVQLEHRKALEHIDEILKVEGVDVFFVGPMDLSLSFGKPGDFNAADVRDALAHLFTKIKTAGKIAGTSGTPATLRRYRDQGVQYLYTHLQTLLVEGRDTFRATMEG